MELSREQKDRIWKILIEENRHIAANWRSRGTPPEYHTMGDNNYLLDTILGITETLQGVSK